jgi:hypothetical protein
MAKKNYEDMYQVAYKDKEDWGLEYEDDLTYNQACKTAKEQAEKGCVAYVIGVFVKYEAETPPVKETVFVG